MSIVLARVDNRLIHGQVVMGWLPAVNAGEAVVVSRAAAASGVAGKMLRMALPPEYDLKIFEPAAAARYLAQNRPQRSAVIIEGVSELKDLIESGLDLGEVNIGNTAYEAGKTELGESFYATAGEADFLRFLAARGVKIGVQALPTTLPGRLK